MRRSPIIDFDGPPLEINRIHDGIGEIEIQRPFDCKRYLPAQIEVWKIRPGQTEGEHLHHDNISEIYHVLSGRARFTLDSDAFILEAGQMVLVEPGHWHSLANDSAMEDLQVMLIWGRQRRRQVELWQEEALRNVKNYLVERFRRNITSCPATGLKCVEDTLPDKVLGRLMNGWPPNGVFYWREPPCNVDNENENGRIVSNLWEATSDPRWSNGSSDWASFNTIVRDPAVAKALLSVLGEGMSWIRHKSTRVSVRTSIVSRWPVDWIGAGRGVGIVWNIGGEPALMEHWRNDGDAIRQTPIPPNGAVSFELGVDFLKCADSGQQLFLCVYEVLP